MSESKIWPITQKVWANLDPHLKPSSSIIVAYSGGIDSHVLLHILSERTADYSLQAWHVNHGLSQHAAKWAQHCQEICQERSISYRKFEVNIPQQTGESLEALAREARYQALGAHLPKEAVLLTAHNENDQAETLLLQMMRGTGLSGLCGIAAQYPFEQGMLVRPLLGCSRQEIEHYAKFHCLNHIEDDSNTDLRFMRNRIRHCIMAQLQEIHPGFTKNMARTATVCAQTQAVLNTYLAQDLAMVSISPKIIDLEKLAQFDANKIQALLRFWLQTQKCQMPSQRKLAQIQQQMLFAQQDKHPQVQWGRHLLRRYNGHLYLNSIQTKPADCASVATEWDLSKPLKLPNQVTWHAKKVKGKGIDSQKLHRAALAVCFRVPGQRLPIWGENNRRQVKHLFQTLKIPPWERSEVPLFLHEGQLVAIGSYWVAQGIQPKETDGCGWCIEKVS